MPTLAHDPVAGAVRDDQPIGEPSRLAFDSRQSSVSRRYSGSERGWYSRTVMLTEDDALDIPELEEEDPAGDQE